MRQRRRATIAILLGLVALLGVVLFFSVRPSTMFSIAAPRPMAESAQPFNTHEPQATLTRPLAQVSGTTLLEKPRYTGQDTAGRSWTVEAETALQGGSATSTTYVLQNVRASWSDPSRPEPLTLTATEGHYNQPSATIRLTGSVQATGLGLTIAAPVVEANLTTRHVVATGTTQTTGRLGTTGGWHIRIKAPTLAAQPSASKVVFTGGVHTQLVPIKE